MFTLAAPLWLLLLPAWLGWLWFSRRGRGDADGATVTLAHPDLGPLLDTRAAGQPGTRLENGFSGLAVALLILALARPQWVGDWIPETPEGREIVLLLDASKTMSIADFKLGDAPVERLAVLKGIVARFVEARRGDRFGVIAFGSVAATLVPPSFDRALVTGVLERLQVGVAGDNTAIGDAIGLALKQLQEHPRLRPALILFSDGDSTAGDISPREAVELARRMGVPVYAVQIGGDLFASPERAPAEDAEPGLQEIAAATGGRFYQAGNTAALQNVIRDIGQLEKTVARPSRGRAVDEWYFLPLLAAAALLTVARLARIRRMAA